jgi:hypothetical protein
MIVTVKGENHGMLPDAYTIMYTFERTTRMR